MPRWVVFNVVGLMGVVIQLAVLSSTVTLLRVPLSLATIIAVEAAILHNFVWHERWTWRERADAAARWPRLVTFHAGNGLVSIVGNLVLMQVFVGPFGMPLVGANLTAIAICATINFLISDTLVYKRSRG